MQHLPEEALQLDFCRAQVGKIIYTAEGQDENGKPQLKWYAFIKIVDQDKFKLFHFKNSVCQDIVYSFAEAPLFELDVRDFSHTYPELYYPFIRWLEAEGIEV